MAKRVIRPYPWNGAKTWLANELDGVFSNYAPKRYLDPFLGSGEVARLAAKAWPLAEQHLGDLNPWLAAFWRAEKPAELAPLNVAALRATPDSAYSAMSDQDAAIRFLVCVHTAWGNRWRTAPNGRMTDSVCPVDIRRTGADLPGRVLASFDARFARIPHTHGKDWKWVISEARPGDLVYLDPPYPDTTGYGAEVWTFADTLDVVDASALLAGRGVHVVVSNMVEATRLFERQGMTCITVQGQRAHKARKARSETLAHTTAGNQT